MKEPAPRQWSYWLLFTLLCLGLTVVIYGTSLSLPFFFDDFVHYPFVEANNLAGIWLTTDELAYYRPLNFSIWRLTYVLFQRHNPEVDHAVNLLIHAANGVMVGWLASRLWSLRGDGPVDAGSLGARDDWWRITISAALFLLFPFSYQAVPWIGSLSHITATALILLSLLFFVQMKRTHAWYWGAASLATALLAPFAHENGVLVMPFAALIELTTPGLSSRWRQTARTAVIWSLPLLLYVPIWLSLPRVDDGGLFSNNLERMLQNSAYFVQGAFYPFTQLGGWLHYERGLGDMTAVALLSFAGFTVAGLIQITHRATLRSLLPWTWIVLASLPAVIFLLFDYVINGPRLLMVAGVGVAWLWADVILLFGRGGESGSRERKMRVGTAIIFALWLLFQNAKFVGERMTMHRILGDGFKEVVEATKEANAAGQRAVVLNFPSWLAPKEAAFALGHEGALFWPDYIPPELFMSVHSGERGELTFVKLEGIRPPLESYHYGLTGSGLDWPALLDTPSQILKTEYGADELALTPAGVVGEKREPLPTLASFSVTGWEEEILLLDARVRPEVGGVGVETVWQASGAPPNLTIFMHLIDGSGKLVAQADGDPLGGSFPFDQWPDDGRVLDSRWIALGDYTGYSLRIGLYDRLTGTRLEATGMDGTPYPENAFAISLQAPPAE